MDEVSKEDPKPGTQEYARLYQGVPPAREDRPILERAVKEFKETRMSGYPVGKRATPVNTIEEGRKIAEKFFAADPPVHESYESVVYIDTAGDYAGTEMHIGTIARPVNNFEDARKIMEAHNIERAKDVTGGKQEHYRLVGGVDLGHGCRTNTHLMSEITGRPAIDAPKEPSIPEGHCKKCGTKLRTIPLFRFNSEVCPKCEM